MNKSTLVKLGALAASSFMASAAFAGVVEFQFETPKPKIEVTAPVAVPTVKPTATLNMSGFNASFAAPKVVAKPNQNMDIKIANRCDQNFPQVLAKDGDTTVEMVNTVIKEGILSADSTCSMGFQEAGPEARGNAVKTAVYAHFNGYTTAAADQKPGILGRGLQAAMNNTISIEEATKRTTHVTEYCGWLGPKHDKDYARPASDNDDVEFGKTGSIN